MTLKRRAITDYILTSHARIEIARRGINEELIKEIMSSPDDRLPVRPGRDVLHSLHEDDAGSRYLVRIFVDTDRTPAEVVTAYRTSKIRKYLRVPE